MSDRVGLIPPGRNVLHVFCANPACKHVGKIEEDQLPPRPRSFKCGHCGSRTSVVRWIWTAGDRRRED